MEFTLLGAAAIAAGAAYGMLWWEAKRGNAARCAGNLWETALVSVVIGIFIGRIVTMLIDGVNPIAHPLDIMLVRSGVSTVGASIGAAVVFLWQSRTCLGTTSDLPWALAQGGSTLTRHPVGIYAALLLAIAAIAIAWWKAYRRPVPGMPASLAVVAAAAVRLATEPLQPSLSGGPVWFYATALVVGLVGVVWFGVVGSRRST